MPNSSAKRRDAFRRQPIAYSPKRAISVLHVLAAPTAGGIETYVKQLAVELQRLGCRSTIAFMARASQHGRSSEFEASYLAELDAAGISYHFFTPSDRRNPLSGAWRMRRFCKAHGIDVYHAHLKSGVVLGLLLGIPRVATHHNGIPEVPLWTYRLFNRMVDRWVGISDSCGAALRRFTGRPVTVIRNGVETALFDPKVRRVSADSTIGCIAVGRIFEQKNYTLLVEAIAQLPAFARDRVQVLIAGEGPAPEVAKLEHAIRRNGLAGTVQLIGNRRDIAELLARAQLFLMSSAWEGYPISLLEATASGLPFIATDVGGCREIAEMCGNGLVVPPGNPQAFAAALQSLIDDPARVSSLSEAAVNAVPLIDIAPAAAAHLALYRELLGRTT